MDPTGAEDIMKRWQEYTEELYKSLNDPDTSNGIITHLELDILDCEVKWSLGSMTKSKASGDDGIPAHLFQILKDDTVKVLHTIHQKSQFSNLEKSAVAKGLDKVSFHSNLQKGQCQRVLKVPYNYTHFTC